MDGVDVLERRRSLVKRLRLKGMGCCGPSWSFRASSALISVRDDDVEEDPQPPQQEQQLEGRSSSGSGMNLAMALALERYLDTEEPDGSGGVSADNRQSGETAEAVPSTPLRMSLLRFLVEETEGQDAELETTEEKGGLGSDIMCCVCMGRKKGAAFIPCGHTFCRVCSREIWSDRGSCPLCNRMIHEVLDIF